MGWNATSTLEVLSQAGATFTTASSTAFGAFWLFSLKLVLGIVLGVVVLNLLIALVRHKKE